jgi:GNAT superfamily N-acetyltransferase
METFNQDKVKEFVTYLKKVKYKNILQNLKLLYITDNGCPHLYLEIIRIRKPARNQGYGSKVMKDIVRFADKNNVQIRLYALGIYGSDLKRLYIFYRRFGFFLIKNNRNGHFVRNPIKKRKKTAINQNKLRIFV